MLERRAADSLSGIGETHGIPAASFDGNDVLAVYQAAREAVDRARRGEGPTLLECRTYRWRGHVGASWDMDVGVKRRDELEDWLPRDPIARLRAYLLELGTLQEELDVVTRALNAEIDEAVDFAKRSPYPEADNLVEHVFHSGEEAG